MKKLLLVALIVSASFSTYANGQNEKKVDDGKIHLTGMHQLNITDEAAIKSWEEMYPVFQEMYPNIEIEWEFIAEEGYHDKLQAMSVANQLPDLMYLWPGKRTSMVTGSGKIKDLRPWLRDYTDNFASKAMAAQGINGEMYELPEMVTVCHVMYINERLLNELGLEFPNTYEELLAQGKVIRDAGLIPIAMDNADGWQMQSTLLSTLTERSGGIDWMNRAVTGKGASFADEEFVNALSIIKTLSDQDMFSPGINSASYGIALDAFVREEAVYMIDGGWRVKTLQSELTDEQIQYIRLETFPDIPNQKGQSGSTDAVAGVGFGMNENLTGEEAESAWKWIWFYSGPEGSKIKNALGTIPAYKLDPPKDSPLINQRFVEFNANVSMSPVIDAIMDSEGMGVLQPAVQEMMMGAKTPQQVATEYENWVAANDSSRK